MDQKKVSAIVETRHRISTEYADSKGWGSLDSLTIDQILEIRALPEWKDPLHEDHPVRLGAFLAVDGMEVTGGRINLDGLDLDDVGEFVTFEFMPRGTPVGLMTVVEPRDTPDGIKALWGEVDLLDTLEGRTVSNLYRKTGSACSKVLGFSISGNVIKASQEEEVRHLDKVKVDSVEISRNPPDPMCLLKVLTRNTVEGINIPHDAKTKEA